MSPATIVRIAGEKGLDIIGITDHNSTRQAGIIRDYARTKGIFVLTGAEINSREEVHGLTFFPDDDRLSEFQAYLDRYLPSIPNNPEKFGYQVVAGIQDEILYEEEKLLITGLDRSIEQIEKKVHELDGIFIPAHIDKSRFSILSQLGFIPSDLNCDALELSCHASYSDFIRLYPRLQKMPFIQSSDAHYPQDIGKASVLLQADDLSFDSIRKAIHNNPLAI